MSQKNVMVKLKVYDKQNYYRDYYINGHHVVFVRPESNDLCWVTLSDSSLFLVQENIESVVAKLK